MASHRLFVGLLRGLTVVVALLGITLLVWGLSSTVPNLVAP